MKHYDIAIIGAGVAGSLLLLELIAKGLGNLSILVIEPSEKNQNDRMISFWSE